MGIDKNLQPLKQTFSRAMTTSRERLSNVFGKKKKKRRRRNSYREYALFVHGVKLAQSYVLC